jgi:O-antigen/teichoic acid export membrane protein
MLLNSRVSSAQVGLYSLAVALAELTFLLTDSISQVVLPRQIDEELGNAALFTARVVRTNALVGAMFIGAILIGSPVIVPGLYGQSFSGAIAPLVALSPGVLALGAIRPIIGFLVKLDKPLILSSITVGAMILNVVLNLVLIPPLGIVGAGLASAVSYMLLAAFHIAWLIRAGGITGDQLRPRWEDVSAPLALGLRRIFRRG